VETVVHMYGWFTDLIAFFSFLYENILSLSCVLLLLSYRQGKRKKGIQTYLYEIIPFRIGKEREKREYKHLYEIIPFRIGKEREKGEYKHIYMRLFLSV